MTSVDNRPLKVFLCHSSNDKPAVRELYQKLCAEPWIQPWLDEEELYPGQDWNMEIEKAVEAADAIIVCLTKNSINKEGYVQRELRIVLDFADYKPEGTLYIIPVRLEECEPPRRLRAWQYADYFEGQRERALERLLVSLKRRADSLALGPKESVRKKSVPFEKESLENLTRKHGLVQEITNTSSMSNPSGMQGFEMILLEKIGDGGTQYYTSLKPGDSLKMSERVFSNYMIFQVDMRHQMLPISGSFNTKNHGKKVTIELNVRFYVYDARLVATENIDPLGELKSNILSTLNRELQKHSETDINASIIDEIVQKIVPPPRLGLTVENVDVIDITTGSVDIHKPEIPIKMSEIEDDGLEYKRTSHVRSANSDFLLDSLININPQQTLELLSILPSDALVKLGHQLKNSNYEIRHYIEEQKRLGKEVDSNELKKIISDFLKKGS